MVRRHVGGREKNRHGAMPPVRSRPSWRYVGTFGYGVLIYSYHQRLDAVNKSARECVSRRSHLVATQPRLDVPRSGLASGSPTPVPPPARAARARQYGTCTTHVTSDFM